MHSSRTLSASTRILSAREGLSAGARLSNGRVSSLNEWACETVKVEVSRVVMLTIEDVVASDVAIGSNVMRAGRYPHRCLGVELIAWR